MSQVSYLHLRHTDAAAWLFLHTSCQVVFILTNKVRIAFACWTFVACKFSIPRLTVGYISSLKHESYEFAVSLALLVSSMTCLVPWTSSHERTPCHVHFTRLYSNVCCSQHLQLALECKVWSGESCCVVLERNAQSCNVFMLSYQTQTYWASLRRRLQHQSCTPSMKWCVVKTCTQWLWWCTQSTT